MMASSLDPDGDGQGGQRQAQLLDPDIVQNEPGERHRAPTF